MPKFTVTLTETLTHRITVGATTEMQAKESAENFLTENDHKDRWLFSARGFEARAALSLRLRTHKPDLIAESKQ